MANSLVIVESPAKARTISKFLTNDFNVLACKGHIRALPSKQGSVEINEDVIPKYEIIPQSQKYLKEISKALKGSDKVYLATDLDREGEAIAWHLVTALGLDKKKKNTPEVKRIVFHEITKEAILDSLKHARDLAINLVDSQQARVVLDYLVGFNLSPFLWKKIRYGLSAGRVQSVALRLICEREKEIETFQQQEFWSIKANLSSEEKHQPFKAQLVQMDGKKLDKMAIKNEDESKKILSQIEGADFVVKKIQKKEIKRNPQPPFITSTMQQEAARKLGFSAKRTMTVAQQLYEGIDVGTGSSGLITYMRTDSVNLAQSALQDINNIIVKSYGSEYALKSPRVFPQKSKNAQEAHEAIRPTDVTLIPDNISPSLSKDQFKLYSLIWKRAVASQMANAVMDSVSVDIDAKDRFIFRASGSTIKFPGFMKLYIEGEDNNGGEEKDESVLPPFSQNQTLKLLELIPEQHFTQPPPRYTEATLIKTLEANGIGRPSTYASIISIIQEREYAKLIKKRFFPEDIGMVVNDLLSNHFSKYFTYRFTSYLEDRLDQIARGESQWKPTIKEFWEPFISLIQQKEQEVQKSDITTEKTDEVCPKCQKPLVIKLGRYGRFYACSGFPECRFVKPLKTDSDDKHQEDENTEEICPECGDNLVMKQGRYGRFMGCARYPECNYIKKTGKSVSLGIACPDCATGEILERKSKRGRIFFGCSQYPKCKFASWDKPVLEKCPECGAVYLVEKYTKKDGLTIKCPNKECKYKRVAEKQDTKD